MDFFLLVCVCVLLRQCWSNLPKMQCCTAKHLLDYNPLTLLTALFSLPRILCQQSNYTTLITMHNGVPPPESLAGDGVHKNVMFSSQLFLKEVCMTRSLVRRSFLEMNSLISRTEVKWWHMKTAYWKKESEEEQRNWKWSAKVSL